MTESSQVDAIDDLKDNYHNGCKVLSRCRLRTGGLNCVHTVVLLWIPDSAWDWSASQCTHQNGSSNLWLSLARILVESSGQSLDC